jgi:hypothetical protein
MSKTSFEGSENLDDDLLSEYHLDYSKAKPNRFTNGAEKQLLKVVVLDEDVAQVFTTPESVNSLLRVLIESMPQAITVQPNKPVGADQ